MLRGKKYSIGPKRSQGILGLVAGLAVSTSGGEVARVAYCGSLCL